jgi:hypothetical protein
MGQTTELIDNHQTKFVTESALENGA